MGIVEKLIKFEVVTLHREIVRERENALSNEFVYFSISNANYNHVFIGD